LVSRSDALLDVRLVAMKVLTMVGMMAEMKDEILVEMMDD